MIKRSHMCAATAAVPVGQKVCVTGWVQKCRNLGGLVFIDLRDRTGIVQVVVNEQRAGHEIFEAAANVRLESVLGFTGMVSAREGSQINPGMVTGHVEILADTMEIFSQSAVLPYNLDDHRAGETMRYRYRYLDLRQPALQANMLLRHRVSQQVRNYLSDHGFLEIETPMLCRSTPEGARDYLVPSRVSPGQFYALPQSPQIYKQLLMVSGYDRYFQLARCFRDEDLRADRQPEFTQIDLEMSFADQEDVMNLAQGMLNKVFEAVVENPPCADWPRMTYTAAMADYGSDKPDIRFGLRLHTVNPIFENTTLNLFIPALQGGRIAAICLFGGSSLTRKEIDGLADVAKTYRAGGLAWLVPGEAPRGSIAKGISPQEMQALCRLFGATDADLLLFVADADADTASTALGQVRLALGKKMALYDDKKFAPLWVTDFPMFESADGRLYAKHHPFTSPADEDIHLLSKKPMEARAKAYDAVLNGCELGGGSVRIYQSDLQETMFNVLGFSKQEAWERFGFLLEALQYGTPPHGGFACGLDRLIMLLSGSESIRDVIAFPKMQNARCLMADAPNVVAQSQLDELYLRHELP